MKKKNELSKICLANEQLKPYFGSGLGAVKGSDRKYIKVPDTKLLGGSVALDEATKKTCPHDNRWDYAIEYDENTFFIEVHPASSSEIECVIQKVKFVIKWLKDNAPEFLTLAQKTRIREFYWVSSGKTDLRIVPGSQQGRKLALNHIRPVGKIWDYSKLFG
ncbi:MAG: hypothetical protein K2H47_07510 [Muribaculaceae bacterium]|nr:hypothetical protein [Muribaculaceae bacterium]